MGAQRQVIVRLLLPGGGTAPLEQAQLMAVGVVEASAAVAFGTRLHRPVGADTVLSQPVQPGVQVVDLERQQRPACHSLAALQRQPRRPGREQGKSIGIDPQQQIQPRTSRLPRQRGLPVAHPQLDEVQRSIS